MKLERLAKLGTLAAVFGTMGCSDPVPPPAQASLFFVVGPPAVQGAGCAISGSYVANIGGPPKPALRDPGPRVIDGQDDARVGCRVSGGGSFSLSGSAEKGPTAFRLVTGNISQGIGTGQISVAGPGTAGRTLTSPRDVECELSASRDPYQIAPGSVWAEFDCPLVTNASDPGSRCSARGEFVFENCEQ
jgi:hypothetical protein